MARDLLDGLISEADSRSDQQSIKRCILLNMLLLLESFSFKNILLIFRFVCMPL